MTLLYQWLGHFYFTEQKLHRVELACGKNINHIYTYAISPIVNFIFHQSLTKTLQFLAKHGFPLLLLWLVMASGYLDQKAPPSSLFPSLIFPILTHFKFQNSTVKNFSQFWQRCLCHVYILSFPFMIGLQSQRYVLTLFEVHQNL